ncbi:MAG TPA: hypothetical protein VF186_08695 [Gaiellaceae bacterium]
MPVASPLWGSGAGVVVAAGGCAESVPVSEPSPAVAEPSDAPSPASGVVCVGGGVEERAGRSDCGST